MKTKVGAVKTQYSARGIASYSVELLHDGLNKHRIIKSSERSVLQKKSDLQVAEWDERWELLEQKNNNIQRKEEKKATADQKSNEASALLESLENILNATLKVNDAINWEKLKNTKQYSEAKPPARPIPPAPQAYIVPEPPKEIEPKFDFWDSIFSSRRQKKISDGVFASEYATRVWREAVIRGKEEEKERISSWKKSVSEIERKNEADLTEWNKRRDEFILAQRAENEAVNRQRDAYQRKDPDAISEYCDLVLSRSNYPDIFPKEFDIKYEDSSKLVVVDYGLPSPSHIPKLRSVKYVAIRDEIENQYLSDAQHYKIYDEVLYQIALRTLHELFEADVINAIETVAFNGFVTSVDKRTGNPVTACVMSFQATKVEFSAIDLRYVDPKTCFQSLKGVSGTTLYGLMPVQPVVKMNKEDARFVDAYEVASSVNSNTNLASMHWEDFEHLVRELFSKEFASSGGEVRITQASRDGGVDAVVFDPDPIRGGKIVIQAKRYTNIVGVAAVRELYGTVHSENAIKGILVTTSDFGPESYAYANENRITLINGSNLLYMLERHGHQARIDIQEAKNAGIEE